MTKKAEIIVEMLRRLEDARETQNGPSGLKGDGQSIPLMPPTWNDSYRELDRCLALMREKRPSQHCHVCERYVVTSKKLHRKEVHIRNGKITGINAHEELYAGQPTIKADKIEVIIYRWQPWVRAEKVRRGIEWLTNEFRGEPYLPLEFVQAA